jgi:predicted porin
MNCMRPRVRALICAAMFAAGTAASAQEPKSDFVFAFHGIVGGSLYAQDSILAPGNGGQSWFVAQQFSTHKALVGGDVRQSRFSLAFAGPKVFQGATPRAYVEVDFSNNAGQGGYGDVSLLPRLRHVYAELNWGNTAIRFGQDHELLIGSSPWAPPAGPASVGHIGYPLVYQAGAVGWREPGVAVYQQFPGFFGAASLEFAAMVMRSQWVAPLLASGLPNQAATSAGEQSGYPGFEARVQAVGKNFRLGVSGHWNQSHRAGIGNQETAALPDLITQAVQVGARLNAGPITLQGGGYAGKNLAPLLGALLQFQGNAQDIQEIGGWAQAGFNFTPELSVWGLAGTSKPSNSDVIAAGGTRLQNTVVSGMLRYQEGGYAIGLEYAHWHTRTTVPVPGIAPDGNLDGNQLMLSGFYFF